MVALPHYKQPPVCNVPQNLVSIATIIDRFCKCQDRNASVSHLVASRSWPVRVQLASHTHRRRHAHLPPKASLEWLWVPKVVLYIVQAPLLPSHRASRHAPHWMQQTANLLDTLDRPTGPGVVYSKISLHYTNVPSHQSLRLQGYPSMSYQVIQVSVLGYTSECTRLYKLVYQVIQVSVLGYTSEYTRLYK